MMSDQRTAEHKLLRMLLAATAAFFLLLFLYAAMRRLHYGYDFDRMEGAAIVSVWRVFHHLPLYTAPSMTYVPFLYTPGYFYAAAGMSHILGLSFGALRAVSILSTLATLLIIYAWVWRESGRSHIASIVAAGTYVSLYSVLYAWLDMGRVDAFSAFLMVAALYATRFYPLWIASLIWVAAVQTKQSFLLMPVLLYPVWFRHWKKLATGLAVYAAVTALVIIAMQHATGGWYSFYIFGTVQELKLLPRQAALFPAEDVFVVFPFAIAVAVIAAFLRKASWTTDRCLFYLWTSFIFLGTTWFVRAHIGANVNSLMPLYVWISIAFGVALSQALTGGKEVRGMQHSMAAAVLVLSLFQMAMHLYNPGRWIGTATMASGREALRTQLRSVPGDVWVVNHAWEAMQAGKPEHAEMDALDAVLGRPSNQRTAATKADEARMITDGTFSAVVLDLDAGSYVPAAGFTSDAFHQSMGLATVAPGAKQRAFVDTPQYVYLPCSVDSLPGDPWHTHTTMVDRSNCR